MLDRHFLRPILDDDSLTRGLGDEEARLLVDWLVERAEQLVSMSLTESVRRDRLGQWCRRARSIGRFVTLWCHDRRHGAAAQLAGAERFLWELPSGPEEAGDLMARILHYEEECHRVAA